MAVLDRFMAVGRAPGVGPTAEAVVLPPDISFLLAHGVPYQTLAEAADIARSCRADAATTLLNEGLISEERYYRALAGTLGSTFLEDIPLSAEARTSQILDVGAAPLAQEASHAFVAAPRGRSIRKLIEARGRLAVLPAITTPTRFRLAVFAQRADEIAAGAAEGLRQHYPEWSCRPGPQPADLVAVGILISLSFLFISLPNVVSQSLLAIVQIATLAMLTARLASVLVPSRPDGAAGRCLNDAALPTYTVLVALYREARVVDQLIPSLARLDYPKAKLDIKFLIEADDTETAAALHNVPMPARFEIVTAPPGWPRTKPRALNVALPLARGDYLVVYDAEDTIDPRQLRLAATLFARAPASTACLQGRLLIDNCRDGVLTRLFTMEYSALFDVLGPALAAWRMPTPLGGTTTHFRTRILRELHGWDAWNVTEDADLGIRMALAGYHVGDLPSDTKEEGLVEVTPWLRQRTRWMKGFLQTSFTHLRHPQETFVRLGIVGSFFALMLLPATVLSALVYPFMSLWTVYQLAFGPEPDFGILSGLTHAGSQTVLAGGIMAMLVPALVACWRRKRFDLMPWALLLPVYFGLVSAAAWLAVVELARHPHRWNKTEHGLARTSRSGARRPSRSTSGALTSASPTPLRSRSAAVAG